MNFIDMKLKRIGTLALLLLTLGACSETEIIGMEEGNDNAIRFEAYAGVQTRGTETKLANIQTSGFGIMAYMTRGSYTTTGKSAFMNNQLVEYKSNAWTYSPTKYWPNNGTDKLSFFAYAPYVATNGTQGITLVSNASEDPKLDFSLQTNQNNMVDLVVAANVNQDASTAGSKLTFGFRHVLAGVQMSAKLSESLTGNNQVRLYITGVKLRHTNKLASRSAFNMKTSAWGTPTTYLAAETDLGNATNGILNLPSVSGITGITKGIQLSNSNSQVSLFKTGQSLYLIPINGSTGCNAGDVKAAITYSLLTRATDSGTSWVVSTITKEVPLPAQGFRQGYMQSYLFTIGLNDIAVSAVVTEY